MTMPNERTRMLRWAGEFLKEVMYSAECPEAIWRPSEFLTAMRPLSAYPVPHDDVLLP